MPVLWFKPKAPAEQPEQQEAIIRAIYAGNQLAQHVLIRTQSGFFCMCGEIPAPPENPANHHNSGHVMCPVAAWYMSVEELYRSCKKLAKGVAKEQQKAKVL